MNVRNIEEMVHSLMWLDCKMWGKEGIGSEVGKVGITLDCQGP